MTYLSQRDCCSVLGIEPKTLRQWMRLAHRQFVPHPTDARLKCLTSARVQQLAGQHGRPLPWPIPTGLPETSLVADNQAMPTELAALTQQLTHLQRSLITVQEQVTALVPEVARDRQRLGVLEALVQHLLGSAPLPAVVAKTSEGNVAEATARPERGLLPAEVQARAGHRPDRIRGPRQLCAGLPQSRPAAVCSRLAGVVRLVGHPHLVPLRGTAGALPCSPRYRTRAAHPQLACLSHHPSAGLPVLPVKAGEIERAVEDVRRFEIYFGRSRRHRIPSLRSLAVLAQSQGEFGLAIDHMEQAAQVAEEIDLPGELWLIWQALADLYLKRGEDEQTHRAYSEAARLVMKLAAAIQEGERRKLYLSSPLVQRVLQAAASRGYSTDVNEQM